MSLQVLAQFDDIIKWGIAGGCNAYLVNSKSNCECCMVFKDLLFVFNTSKIDEMREFLNKNDLINFLYGF